MDALISLSHIQRDLQSNDMIEPKNLTASTNCLNVKSNVSVQDRSIYLYVGLNINGMNYKIIL